MHFPQGVVILSDLRCSEEVRGSGGVFAPHW